MGPPNDLILYHYAGSPYAKKVVWYLALRGIEYAECIQPMIMPRPDLEALGVKYRRIPVLAHGGQIYCDTRLIIEHLEKAFPVTDKHPSIYPTSPYERGMVRLLENDETRVFAAASALLPPDLPALKDPRFQNDRKQMSGRSWTREDVLRGRGTAMLVIRDAFLTIEEQVLGDGRKWVLGDQPSIADLQAIWFLHWVVYIPGALDAKVISPELFPRTFSLIKRFDTLTRTHQKKMPKPARLSGSEAAKEVLSSKSQATGFQFDANDPLRLKLGDAVEAFPTDSGSANRDHGRLVGLDRSEAVVEVKAPTGEAVYIHQPRRGFKVRAVDFTKL